MKQEGHTVIPERGARPAIARVGQVKAQRGLKPCWLTAALKSGKKIRDFAIASPAAKRSPENGRRKKTKK
jgi:hypothetical protein